MKNRNFILFIFGNLGSNYTFKQFISHISKPLITDIFKFVQDQHSAICYFSSASNLKEIDEYLQFLFDEQIYSFFIFEEPDVYGMKLPPDIEAYLFSLQNPEGLPKDPPSMNLDDMDENYISWNKRMIQDLGDLGENPTHMEDEDDINEIQKIKANYIQPLELNNILDKINLKGVNSLNEEEKKFLKKLSHIK